MTEKSVNLADGRLGSPSLTQSESADKLSNHRANYGVGRLGIVSDAASEAPISIEQLESSRPAQAPGVAETETPSPVATAAAVRDDK